MEAKRRLTNKKERYYDFDKSSKVERKYYYANTICFSMTPRTWLEMTEEEAEGPSSELRDR